MVQLHNRAPALHPDRRAMVVVATEASPKSGKYQYLLGHHYSGKFECWDVCAFNNWTREIVKRHHKTKAEALITWDQLKQHLEQIAAQPEEQDEAELERKYILGPDGKEIIH